RRGAKAARLVTATSPRRAPRRARRRRSSSAICTIRPAVCRGSLAPRAATMRSKRSTRVRRSPTCGAACQEPVMSASEDGPAAVQPLPLRLALRRVTEDILATLEWRTPGWLTYWGAVGLCFFLWSLALLVWAYQIYHGLHITGLLHP